MLPKLYREIEGDASILFEKRIGEKNVSRLGAFALGTQLTLAVRLPRRLGVSAVVLRIAKDGEETRDIPFAFEDTALGIDNYALTLLADSAFCGGEDALFYYELLFLRGEHTQFSDSINNVDFGLSDRSARKFRLLIYRKDFHVPTWFFGGTMYHVFVDRFCQGQGLCPLREDAVLNSDWENGVPVYPERAGDAFDNNEFFGGNLWGIIEKLDYLSSLGVSVLYLSPIFKAYSNHKYDTGDYEQVDGMFGGDEALIALIAKAKARGIRIILDGVFNHTGDDSRYFNRYGKYPEVGAYQSKSSRYFPWYCFDSYPNGYDSWWDIKILPKLNPECEACREYFVGEGGIVDRYLALGIGGWRLDVADELSDEFLDRLRKTAKHRTEDAIIIGEVWENAADKIAYGKRRRYFRGEQLDSVMNYPVRNAILSFVLEGDGEGFYHTLTELYASYPPFVCHALMNLLGTHDTARILSVLGGAPVDSLSNRDMAAYRLSGEARREGLALLKLAAVLQFTVLGVPSIYYGDEAGLEGGHDPFCRMPFPWGREDAELLSQYRFLGKLRQEHSVFCEGELVFLAHEKHFVAYARENNDERLLILANSGEQERVFSLSTPAMELASGKQFDELIKVAPKRAVILKEMRESYVQKHHTKADKK